MTDATTPAAAPVPAGWYPDPAGGHRSRWWDGAAWTEHFQEPYGAAPAYAGATAALKAPEGTKVYNLWIWLVVFVPYLSLPLLFTIDFSSMFTGINYDDPTAATMAQFSMMTSPGYLALVGVGLLTSWATVLFSYFDYKWLLAAGVPKPFHWAWGFFSVIGYPVYAIGRAVVTKRRTGHGSAVLWATIGMLVVAFIVVIAWSVSITATIMHTVIQYGGQ